MHVRAKILITVVALAAVAGLAVWALASRDSEGDPGAGNPVSAETDYAEALADAPPPLARLYAKGDALIEGGPEEFERQLAALEGYPVVVNKWASWCGPCRFEFPFFQEQAAKRGERIAFIGVDADDAPAAAETFLEDFPLPYPSFSDPDDEIGKLFKGFYFPSTAFYDSSGELVHTRPGPYESGEELASDIERYAQ
jgi:cytochrome c biogenesis protein CcmG/thiol:disulfide interchange protein DsbE